MAGRILFVAIVAMLFLTGPVFGGEGKVFKLEELETAYQKEKASEEERHKVWQKVKPTDEEWKKWQKGLNQMGRFQGIPNERGVAYVLDTKLGHVWFLHAGRPIKYLGRVFPLKEVGKKIIEVP